MNKNIPCDDREKLKKWVMSEAEKYFDDGFPVEEAIKKAVDEAKASCNIKPSCGCGKD